MLAAIGEQLSGAVHGEDEICGVSVRIRFDGVVFQIWNKDSDLYSKAKVSHFAYNFMLTLAVTGSKVRHFSCVVKLARCVLP